MSDPLTLYKLIVLYMLNRVSFPLTAAQISDFILTREYTNFLTLQQVIRELTDTGLVDARTVRNRTQLLLTKDGKQTLDFFSQQISASIRQEIDEYLKENEMELRNEVSILADYYKSTSGEYEAHLKAKEGNVTLVDLIISVPVEETAAAICDNWQKKKPGNLSVPDRAAVLNVTPMQRTAGASLLLRFFLSHDLTPAGYTNDRLGEIRILGMIWCIYIFIYIVGLLWTSVCMV